MASARSAGPLARASASGRSAGPIATTGPICACGLLPAGAEAAGQHHHRDAGRARQSRDAGGHLARRGLGVDSALSGQHQVGSGEGSGQPDRLGDQRDAGRDPCPRRQERRAEASGRTGPGQAGDVVPSGAQRTRQVLQAAGQHGHRGRVGTLLRREDRGGPARAGQRVVDVHSDLDLAQARVEAGEVQPGEVRPVAPGGGPDGHGPGAELQEHPEPAVGGRRAAQAHDHPLCPGGPGGPQQARDACAGRRQGVALIRGDQVEAHGLGHLDHGETVAGHPADLSAPRPPECVGRVDGEHLTAEGVDDGAGGALASVGHRHRDDLGVRAGPAHADDHRLDGLERRHGLLEGVRSKDDPHALNPGTAECRA